MPGDETRVIPAGRHAQQNDLRKIGANSIPASPRSTSGRRKRLCLRAWEALANERSWQRTVVRNMEEVAAKAMLLRGILAKLLSSSDCVAALRREGFVTLPGAVRRWLLINPVNKPADPGGSQSEASAPRCEYHGHVGICDEATALLPNEALPARTARSLSLMTSSRQVEVAKVMRAADNFSGDLAFALLAATRGNLKADSRCMSGIDNRRARQFAKLEKQLVGFQARAGELIICHNDNLFHVAVSGSCVRHWLHNRDLLVWLRVKYPTEATFLESSVQEANEVREPRRSMKLPFEHTMPVSPEQDSCRTKNNRRKKAS